MSAGLAWSLPLGLVLGLHSVLACRGYAGRCAACSVLRVCLGLAWWAIQIAFKAPLFYSHFMSHESRLLINTVTGWSPI